MKARIWGSSGFDFEPHWIEIDGAEPVVIKGFEEFQFFIYKVEATSSWRVTEVSSGMSINGGAVPVGRTRESAIRRAATALRQIDIERFRAAVARNQHPGGIPEVAS